MPRVFATVVLALLAWAANLWSPELLSRESPNFLFGGIFVLAAFVRLGPVSGLIVGLASLAHQYGDFDAASLATSIYLVEGFVVAALHRRTGSLILADLVFWLGIGWALDLVLYGGIAGLGGSYLALLFIKQLFNGALNAAIAELVIDLGPVRRLLGDREPATTLDRWIFRRLSVVFIGLGVITGLLLTRSSFLETERQVDAEIIQAAFDASGAVQDYLAEQAVVLGELAVQVTVAEELGLSERAQEAIEGLIAAHPQFINAGWADAEGEHRAGAPRVDALGDSIDFPNLSDRPYFLGVRETGRPSLSPLILGDLNIRRPEGLEPILIFAYPVLGADGDFDGIVYAAIDATAFRAAVLPSVASETVRLTVLGSAGRVVWSTLPARPIGAEIGPLVGLNEPPYSEIRVYTAPEPSDSALSALGIDLNRAALNRVALHELTILAETPATTVHAAMTGDAGMIAVLFLVTSLLVLASARHLAHRIAVPIVSTARIADRVARDADQSEEPYRALEALQVAEVSTLASGLRAMEEDVRRARAMERDRAERSETRFRVTFDRAASGIALLDAEGRVLQINDRYAAMVGLPAGELEGGPIAPHVIEDPATLPESGLRAVVEGRIPTAGWRATTVDHGQGVRSLEVTAAAVSDADGEVDFIVQVAADVTERQELEARLLHSGKLESIGRLAAGVAHDLNNMLTPVLGYAQLAQEEVADPEVREWLDGIVGASKRAKKVVGQLLAFGRRSTMQLESVDVNDAILEFRANFGALLRADVSLVQDLEPDLPPVLADATQLQQVFINLTTNAQDAMPDGGRVFIRTRRIDAPERLSTLRDSPSAAIEIELHDEGHGVPADQIPHLFEPFYTTKEVGHGTGLGLASVYGIVNQLGGTVEAVSPAGTGLTVRILLPVHAETPPPAVLDDGPEPGPAVNAPDLAAVLTGRTVLIVEDEPEVRALLELVLTRSGARLVVAPDGETAVDFATELSRIDLLVTDAVLPGLDGRRVHEAVLARHPNVATLFVSGYGREVFEREGRIDPKLELLPKPFTIRELETTVARVVTRSIRAS